ncbi:unnamed protein product [Urochloa decumbens]|uniref:Uncharacterized protein n=2 Tax=Urochloa decumbens TaxID=240449 RepID=A0ABC8YKR0_9POAL
MSGAMVSASTGAMTSLLAKLTALLSEEYTKQKGVRRKIESMRDELGSMNALLVKLADAEGLDGQLKQWRNNVRELAYDMEDCIDSFTLKLHHGDGAQPGVIKKMTRKIKRLWARHQVANQIEELTACVKEVSDRRSRYKLDDESFVRSSTPVVIDPRLPVLLAESWGLVGIDGPRDVITGWLMDGDPQLKVVSVVGFGGLGKTTLAMEVYRSLGGHFHHKASASVSRRLDLKKLTKDILSQLEPTEYGRGQLDMLEVEQLIRTLRNYLQDKRYLIVIDDVWSISAWEIVKSVLPENSYHSRVITTTRITNVAKSCCSDSQELIYAIKPLNVTDSQRLFMRRIFDSEDDCPPQLEEVSQAILKKCGGLPLAIISISSLLSTKLKIKDQWERVKDGIGSAPEEASIKMKNILLFSYYDLPYHLRTCLLYISIFPEDHVILRQHLIWKWMAEGLIDGERGQNQEDVGEAYFNELINRSLIQPVDIQYDGRAEACRVHDVLLDIIVSLSEEENFVTIFTGGQVEAKFLQGKIRRLSLHNNFHAIKVQQVTMRNLANVRSAHIFGSCKDISDQVDSPAMRVLDLEGCSLCVQVKNMHKYSQLKYLNLSRTGIREVPKEIGNLQYLETLDLRWGSLYGKLPPAIGQLIRLKHLFVSHDIILPDEITNLRALQVLWVHMVNSIKLVVWFGSLKELRELYMGCINPDGPNDMRNYMQSFTSCLRELGRHNLQLLRIFGYPHGSTVINPLMELCCSSISCSPSPVGSLVHLSHLETWVRNIDRRYLCALSELPCLLFLYITINNATSKSYVVQDKGFNCLKEFRCFFYGGRIRLSFEPGAMPKLQKLELLLEAEGTKCDHGVGANFGLQHLSALKRVVAHSFCAGATTAEVESFESAIRNAVSSHPNHPAIELALNRRREYEMLQGIGELEVDAGQEGASLDW